MISVTVLDEIRGETLSCFLFNSVCFDYNKVCLVQHGAVLSCIFVFKTFAKGFTSVYSDDLNKVIWTLLKIAHFLFKHFFAQKGKTVQNTYFNKNSSARGLIHKMVFFFGKGVWLSFVSDQ